MSPEAAAPAFAALGDPTRLALVARLADGEPRSITRLTEGTGLTRQAVTRHLRVLEGAHLVVPARAGRESLYRAEPATLAGMRDFLDHIAAQWDGALGRLRAFVEKE